MQESEEIFLWGQHRLTEQSERSLGADVHAVYLKDDILKVECSDPCFVFVLSGKKNDLQAKKNKSKTG